MIATYQHQASLGPPMAYEPPSGWVERLIYADDTIQDDFRERLRFHQRRDCPRVKEAGHLMAVDRPYSAARCSGCSPA